MEGDVATPRKGQPHIAYAAKWRGAGNGQFGPAECAGKGIKMKLTKMQKGRLREFEKRLKEREELKAPSTDHPVHKEYELEVIETYKKCHPHARKFDFNHCARRLGNQVISSIQQKYNPRCASIRRAYEEARDGLDKWLDALADMAPVRHTQKVWSLYTSPDSYMYSTQGYGAVKYAREAAERDADHARLQGLQAHVVCVKKKTHNGIDWHGRTYSMPSAGFRVWVSTDRIGCEILKRKPTDLKEWLKSCWKRGVNPRVMNPFLPHGIEEKLGLDYFGNDVRKEG